MAASNNPLFGERLYMKHLAVALILFAGVAQANNDFEKRAVAASLTPAQQEAAKLLIYSTILSKQTGEMVEIPTEIQDRYNSLSKGIGFSVPGGVVAIGTMYSFRQSLK